MWPAPVLEQMAAVLVHLAELRTEKGLFEAPLLPQQARCYQ